MHDLSLNKGLCKAIYNAKYAVLTKLWSTPAMHKSLNFSND